MSLVHEGQNVRIRPVDGSDLITMNQWRKDSEALGGFNPPLLRSPGWEQTKLREHGYLTPEYALFAVDALDGDRLIGKVGYSKDAPGYEHMVRTFSIVGEPANRGKGYATEARILLINYLFLSTNMERIYSETAEANAPARRSLEKSDMRFEGVLRHLVFDVGQWTDMAVYAILRSEWQASPLYAPYREPFLRPWTEKE